MIWLEPLSEENIMAWLKIEVFVATNRVADVLTAPRKNPFVDLVFPRTV